MSDACEVITYDQTNIWGQPCRMGRRTAAHLDYTKKHLGDSRLLIIQSSYNTGVSASAGTHDKDACLDVAIRLPDGKIADWWGSQRFFREMGWAAWYRHPPLFGNHIHMVSLGYGDCPVGEFIPSQVDDYYNHAFGLAGMHTPGSDTSWFPDSIRATIFNYQLWIEDNMAYNDWPDASKNALVNDVADRVVRQLMTFDVEFDPDLVTTMRYALLKGSRSPELIRELADKLGHPL